MNRTVTDPQPLLFFAWLGLSMLSFLVLIVFLLVKPEILMELPTMSPTVVGWTHLMVLGWLCSLFFAAGYQLTPVVTLNPLASRWMSRVHFSLHLIGMPIMIYAFVTTKYALLSVGATGVVLGFLLFAINTIMSSGLQSKWNHLSVIWMTAIFWLLVGASVALVAVFMRLGLVNSSSFNAVLGVHIHTMLVGFFLMILIGAASKLVPMFMLSPEQPQYGSWIAGILLNICLFAAYFGFKFSSSSYRTALIFVGLAALSAYFAQLAYFALKKRKKWDPGMTLFYLSNLTLLPAWWCFYEFHSTDAGSLQNWQSIRSGVFLLTFITFSGCILGIAQKIVPFMLWHHLYSKHLGKAKVPQTIDLLNEWTLWPIALAYALSALFYLFAIFTYTQQLIRPATACMLIAFILVACNSTQFVSHWRHPVLMPFNNKPSTGRD